MFVPCGVDNVSTDINFQVNEEDAPAEEEKDLYADLFSSSTKQMLIRHLIEGEKNAGGAELGGRPRKSRENSR